MRVTPELITELKPGEVFVFGSNSEGKHIAGAAKIAHEKFGAAWGVGEGATGLCFAIDTMSGLDTIRRCVDGFTWFAKQHKSKTFLVTAIGCGIAGYTPEQIAPLFSRCYSMKNVYLPESFRKIIKNIPIS